jgi:hypothetical protein
VVSLRGRVGLIGVGEATVRGRVARRFCIPTVLVAIVLSLGCAPGALAASTGQISGRVVEKNAPHNPIVGIEVCASSKDLETFNEESFRCEKTNGSGDYAISGLASGEYDVEFAAPSNSGLNYITRYYDEKSSFKEAPNAVTVSAPYTTPEVNAELEEGAEITGKVTRAVGGTSIPGIEVCAYSAPKELEGFGCATSDSQGEYTIRGLPTSRYYVEFSSDSEFTEESNLDYVTQYYDGATTEATATKVSAKAPETTTEINASLEEGGRIEGKVTDASTGAAIEGILVCAQAGSGESSLGQCATTGANGEYTISALASGEYKVGFIQFGPAGAGKYITQYYNGKSSLSEAQGVLVMAPNTTPGIDAAMQSTSTPPANTTPPVVSGSPSIGSVLLCAPGLWTGKPTFSYQWLRGGAPIAGANATSYTVQIADAGSSVSCQITAKNAKGEKSARSAGVAIPALPGIPPPPPAPKPLITITGSKVVVSGKSARVHITCSDAVCAGSAELTLQIVVKHRKGKKTVSRKQTLVLAKGSYSLAAGKSETLVLHLTAAGKARLAHVKHHPLAVKLSVSVNRGKTAVRSVLLS